MTSTTKGYLALLAELEALDARIAVARETEREAAIAQIRKLMKSLDISVQDLQEKVAKRRSARVSPLYRDPVSGKTWTGKGRQPAWLGDEPARFLIQPDLLANQSDNN
ncbi:MULTISPECIES: H-NS family nucleoid-associated regulatory protein [Burkholderia]|uniref:H-NS histone family protein n=1 Tax=Burkholderia TaxID=32008 RepID=UPI000CFF357B|nr:MULTISPECIES: H-NS histone family protein [Burkholderia]MBJ9678986.1 H-NS histone family protein [Burkholderia gladioli]MBU9170268.1 H-NS histone family protein [Burkholderia gladioli]MBU9180265.1 H-NS histone family protein [Burkholderia gladioli]MBU9276868.1 H-NS histone family protein [Burkholderia gladioli]MBU9323960.1 H-NS histone family protein [Burkholderia gladioli]